MNTPYTVAFKLMHVETPKGKYEISGKLEIDVEKLIIELGSKAALNKSRRSHEVGGLVRVKINGKSKL